MFAAGFGFAAKAQTERIVNRFQRGRSMPDREYFDILLVIPLEEELLEVQKFFPTKRNLSTDTAHRFEVDTGVPGLSMLMVVQEQMGKTSAYHAAAEALAEYDVSLVVCLGIAGSLTDDLSLCDVCYSELIIDVYDNSKASDGKEGGTEVALSPSYYPSPRFLVASLNSIRTFPELQSQYAAWREGRRELAKGMFPEPVVGRKGATEEIGAPKSMNGKIACAAVSKSERYNTKLRGIDRKVLAIETESGGVFEAASRKGIEALTIRGISDHADHSKDQLEKLTGNQIRAFAAQNAASFFKMQLGNPQFQAAIAKCRSAKSVEASASASAPGQARSLAAVVSELSAVYDEKLRQLSPEFKLLEKGYRLPVPRMQSVEYVSGVGARSSADPVEVREALEQHDTILLGLSKNYPDYSLPWVIANDLLTAVVGGKQVLPIVIDGDAVRPPRIGLKEAAYHDFSELEEFPGTQLVFIIDGAPLSSKSKIDFLARQIKKRSGCRFIMITRDETHIISGSEFAASVKAETYQLTSISFLEITHFVEKNFGMTASESEVIALRLRDTFRSFELSAHPTYFAGISKDVLAALLQANRRAELIQLAVDGFLSLVVAEDKANVRLTRTTRSRFLRMLAREIRVEKNIVTRSGLVALARDYAKTYDYDVEPTAFVASFIDSGILHYVGDRVFFSLPFVESYLLAVDLSETPAQAVRYFDVDAEDFDIGTFDLYCEINPAHEVVEKVLAGVSKGQTMVALREGERHILLTNTVRPAMLAQPQRLQSIERSFSKLADDVRSGRGNVKRKQKLLDAADRMREAASDKAGLQEQADAAEPDEEFDTFLRAAQYWTIGTTMLGAAAEHLKAEVKQELSLALVDMAANLAHVWTRAHARVNFEEIRREFTSDESIKTIQNGSAEGADIEETRRQVAGLVDLLEFSWFSAPLRRLLDHLCESARLRVLAVSVERASVQGEVQRLVHAAWLADIDGKRGSKRLIEVIKDLPPSPFLRVVVASHLMTRVYWNQWDLDHRLHLLDAAEIAVRPLLDIRKGEIKRLIEGQADDKGPKPE
ncbi:hypothetical protein QIH85_25645 [Bradyrhizobium japonicum]|uniref:phosphorylase family protein n=1 Tax=Bradyrhizobium japonicum TaxID=375 RepID=UPI002714E274|nr:hypothetical protein [Bradyrhizobium japonicum]WLB25247.1 hypothetical protein QIH85_25645 [Bradyrhizobium japonicum]